MTDILDQLLEAVVAQDDQGESLEFALLALPRGRGEAISFGALPAVEQMDSGNWDSPPPWVVQTAWGGASGGAVRRGGEMPSLEAQVAQVARTAQLAQQMEGRIGVLTTVQETSAQGNSQERLFREVAQSFVGGRQSVATERTAQSLDRAIERDARRYDGGFLLE